MTALLLAPVPIAAALLAVWLLRGLAPVERAVVLTGAALASAVALQSPSLPQNDAWVHYLHLRAALEDPRGLLDLWDRPGFTLLYAAPAALGITAARLASAIPAVVAAAATVRAARALGLAHPWAAALILFSQYDFFGEAGSTMTELPFSAALAVAVAAIAERRAWLAGGALGWCAITRPEGPVYAALGAAWLLGVDRRPGPVALALLPFPAYVALASALHADPLWLVNANPYRGMVAPRLELRQLTHSWFVTAVVRGQPPVLLALEIVGAVATVAWVPRLRGAVRRYARHERTEGSGAVRRYVRHEREEGGRPALPRHQREEERRSDLPAASRLLPLLVPLAVSFLLLTFLRIGPTDAWRETRYIVSVAPALALLGAAGLDATLAAFPRAAPPTLLAVAAWGAAWALAWQWHPRPGDPEFLASPYQTILLGAALALWLARDRVSPRAALALLLAAPLAGAPPGAWSRHRPGQGPPGTATSTGAARPDAAAPASQDGW